MIRRPLANAFLVSNDVTSFIVLLQQVCNGLSRQTLVYSPALAKQDNFNVTNSEDQIVEVREFFGQVLSDVVRNLKLQPGAVQITQTLLEVNYLYFFFFFLNNVTN